MKFGRNIHGAQQINPIDFVDPLTLILGPPFVTFVLLAWRRTVEVFLHSWRSESSKYPL